MAQAGSVATGKRPALEGSPAVVKKQALQVRTELASRTRQSPRRCLDFTY